MTPALLTALGVVSQVLSVMIAFVGLWKTWHEFAGSERFRNPFIAAVRAIVGPLAGRFRTLVWRLRGRPSIQGYGAVVLGGGGVINARGRMTWGPLPVELQPALAELHRRTLDLSKAQADATERLDDAVGGFAATRQRSAVAASVPGRRKSAPDP